MVDNMLGIVSVIKVKVVNTSLRRGVVVNAVADTSVEVGDGVRVNVGVDCVSVRPITEEEVGTNSEDVMGSKGVRLLIEGVKTNDDSLVNVRVGLTSIVSVGDGVMVSDCTVNGVEIPGENIELVIGNSMKLEDCSRVWVGVTCCCTVVVGGSINSDDRERVGSCVNVSRMLDEAPNTVVSVTGTMNDVDGDSERNVLKDTPTVKLAVD